MKFLLLVCLLATYAGFSQPNNFKCPCSEIGIDSLWADSNKVSCYLIPVQRDVSKKSSGRFNLAVLVAPAVLKTNETPLLYLHGGPGIATLENVPRYLKSKTWDLLRQERSLVFFDYRGTGFSEPVLCPDIQDSLAELERKKVSAQEIQAHKIELYKKCRMQLLSGGIAVSSFNSFQLAQDAESIRKALGIDKWNVYGVSFGTTVALNLLRSNGQHINAMILDSPFPPNAPWLDFVRPFATSFKVLEEKIAGDPAAFSRFPSVRNDFVKAVERLNNVPTMIKINDSGKEYPYTGNDFAWSIWNALLKPAAIPFVPLALNEVANGNDSVLSKWAVAFSNPNSFGKFSELQSKAILCYEGKPKTEADSKTSLLSQYPDFASFNIDFEGELCAAWQPETAAMQAFEPVVSNVPVLILSGEYDPVCPPLFGEITAKTLSRSTFINIPAASHAAIHVDDCIRDVATVFLKHPAKKLSFACVKDRPRINFITGNLPGALTNIKGK